MTSESELRAQAAALLEEHQGTYAAVIEENIAQAQKIKDLLAPCQTYGEVYKVLPRGANHPDFSRGDVKALASTFRAFAEEAGAEGKTELGDTAKFQLRVALAGNTLAGKVCTYMDCIESIAEGEPLEPKYSELHISILARSAETQGQNEIAAMMQEVAEQKIILHATLLAKQAMTPEGMESVGKGQEHGQQRDKGR